ncbi:MAG: TonB-dependent receptor [Myxococcota bacterium]
MSPKRIRPDCTEGVPRRSFPPGNVGRAQRGPAPRAVAAGVLWGLWVLLLGGRGAEVVHAQEPPSTSRAERGGITLPTLRSMPDVSLTAAARTAGLTEAEVVLVATIDDRGRVLAAVVAEPAGYGLDEVARAALLEASFEPARRDGRPILAKVRFAVSFAAVAATLPAALVVTVVDGRGRPRAGVEMFVLRGAEEGRTATTTTTVVGRTDATGQVRFDDLSPGPATLLVEGGTGETPVALAAGKVARLRIAVAAGQAPSAAAKPGTSEPAGADPSVIDVTVESYSDAELLRRSAQAVTVVELDEARREAADLGEVLARTQGVGVRRSGGLGSSVQFSLNGLTGDQVRFFVDGVPLRFAGYPGTNLRTAGDVANLPVNLFDRIDIYRGVVPIRFGADALGGAVDVRTIAPRNGAGVLASYQAGSFGTFRSTLGGYYGDRDSGVYARIDGFFDEADNDYAIDVEVPDRLGRLRPVTVRRFHDDYRAGGGSLEVGVRDRSWADRLSVRGHFASLTKDLQHNLVMTVPYGGITLGSETGGGTLHYEVTPRDDTTVSLLASYAAVRTLVSDQSSCRFNWFGRCVSERLASEFEFEDPLDVIFDDHNFYGRAVLGHRLAPWVALDASVVPTYFSRDGRNRATDPDQRDLFAAQREVVGLTAGASATFTAVDDKLENVAFIKRYYQEQRAELIEVGGFVRRSDRNIGRVGGGNALRYRFVEGLTAKLSYEYATRLPSPDELFGNGLLTRDNLFLRPEASHNLNLGLDAVLDDTVAGSFKLRGDGFLRDIDDAIVFLANNNSGQFQNVNGARSMGVELSGGWRAPGRWVTLRGNTTYLDFRNTSGEGPFGAFEGDRIPNRPFLFANGSANLEASDLFFAYDRLSLGYNLRFIASFFRSWESAGIQEFKQTIDDQVTHTLRLQYLYREPSLIEASGTLEVQNLTDADVFDFFGVQRPGRAFFFKGMVAWEVVPQ